MATTRIRGRYRGQLKNSMRALFIAGCAALTVTACSNEPSSTDAKPTPTKSASEKPSPTASADPQAAAKKEVLATYSKFWAAQTKAYSQASISGTDLKKYATADALSRAEGDVASLKKSGVVVKGKPQIHPKVTALAVDKKVPAATITDCVDISQWKQIDAKTGKEEPLGKANLRRDVAVVSAEKWGDQWMILKIDPQARKC
ncbi:hypothetical protein [Streptomyces halobius]|uniref:Secreted protein/lipoprotein n=1 Tax=Streptomyces halobius TaxID=2879846 RepID=A0ABY4MIK7_9ACTN|nr:hypothetical protein [Streptomyces halobius]UQA97470.1 hypothetical protein K9S39_41505 [Streptomyces halobius]